MTNPNENFGLDPVKAEELREKAAILLKRTTSGDPEADRTLKQLEILVAMAAKNAQRE